MEMAAGVVPVRSAATGHQQKVVLVALVFCRPFRERKNGTQAEAEAAATTQGPHTGLVARVAAVMLGLPAAAQMARQTPEVAEEQPGLMQQELPAALAAPAL